MLQYPEFFEITLARITIAFPKGQKIRVRRATGQPLTRRGSSWTTKGIQNNVLVGWVPKVTLHFLYLAGRMWDCDRSVHVPAIPSVTAKIAYFVQRK